MFREMTTATAAAAPRQTSRSRRALLAKIAFVFLPTDGAASSGRKAAAALRKADPDADLFGGIFVAVPHGAPPPPRWPSDVTLLTAPAGVGGAASAVRNREVFLWALRELGAVSSGFVFARKT